MDKANLCAVSTSNLLMGHIGSCKPDKLIDKAGYIKLIQALGRGKKGSRSLSLNESFQLIQGFKFGIGTAAQLSAALMLMRVRGESAEEIAGVTLALKQSVDPQWQSLNITLDWPCYAGKRDQLPYMLFCAKALAKQGERILIHGDNRVLHHRHHVGDVIQALGIVEVNSAAEAQVILDRDGLCYVNADKLTAFADTFKDLHQQLGLRSLYQTAIRCLNPGNAQLNIRSYFHGGLASLHVKVAKLLAQYVPASRVLIFKGYQGEAEINPRCSTKLFISPWQDIDCQSAGVSGEDEVLSINLPTALDMLRGDKLLAKHLSANWLTTLIGSNTEYLPTKVATVDVEKETVIDTNERVRAKAVIESTLSAVNLLKNPSLTLTDARRQAEHLTEQSFAYLIRDIKSPELMNSPERIDSSERVDSPEQVNSPELIDSLELIDRLEQRDSSDSINSPETKQVPKLTSRNKQEESANAHY
ncbi:glycosyl transferase [Shewanella pneumatophori]|uniref:Glycosyl transferase n=1 Tax=Shewanella pneumatophori TaxID=314092 RepID=A0A9X1ZAP5_9GAMM|nr:glycosyl transferase [Shewanella pneumatophori]MCL1137025.1 glycosyl transferase [Shewanella pneumatophori]